MKILDPVTHKLRDSTDLQFVDKVFQLKNTKGVWAVVDEIIEHWRRSNPTRYRSFLIEVETKRDTRLNKFGSNKAMTIRSLIDVPEDILLQLRKIYSSTELPFDKEFSEHLYKNYQFMRTAEKK